MKTVVCDLEKWQIDFVEKRMVGLDFECLTCSVDEISDDLAREAEVLSIFVYSNVSRQTLNRFPKLKMIQTMSTGFDHIDIEACKEKGIVVSNVPAYGDNTVAEHAFGLLLSLSRNIHKAYIRSMQEDTFSYDGLIGFDLKSKTIGVIGTGRIGKNMIKIANGFSMNVIAYDPFPQPENETSLGFRYVSLDELYKCADVISLHLPLNKETTHLINKEAIDKMKTGVIIINTARGGIISTEALMAGLQSGKVGGAGLDVLEGEIDVKDETELLKNISSVSQDRLKLLIENRALMNMDNVIVTPHLAFYSREAIIRIINNSADAIETFIAGEVLSSKVI